MQMLVWQHGKHRIYTVIYSKDLNKSPMRRSTVIVNCEVAKHSFDIDSLASSVLLSWFTSEEICPCFQQPSLYTFIMSISFVCGRWLSIPFIWWYQYQKVVGADIAIATDSLSIYSEDRLDCMPLSIYYLSTLYLIEGLHIKSPTEKLWIVTMVSCAWQLSCQTVRRRWYSFYCHLTVLAWSRHRQQIFCLFVFLLLSNNAFWCACGTNW